MQTLQESQPNFVNLTNIPFTVDDGIAARARIGLVVLATDHSVEHEFRLVVSMPGVAVYQSRIPNSPTITPENLRAMEPHITDRTDVILPGVPLDVVAYGCTSASMIIGEERVFELISHRPSGSQGHNPYYCSLCRIPGPPAASVLVFSRLTRTRSISLSAAISSPKALKYRYSAHSIRMMTIPSRVSLPTACAMPRFKSGATTRLMVYLYPAPVCALLIALLILKPRWANRSPRRIMH